MKKRSLTPTRIIFGILSVLIMAAIFYLSCDNSDESSEKSGLFTDLIVQHFIKGFADFTSGKQAEIRESVSFIVRKCAHFSAYAALGFCTSCAVGKRKLLSVGSLVSWGICILYACSDELHQYFVPGRSCELRDVMIDSAGALVGMLLSLAAMAFLFRKEQK